MTYRGDNRREQIRGWDPARPRAGELGRSWRRRGAVA
jgi:hypothetical protein